MDNDAAADAACTDPRCFVCHGWDAFKRPRKDVPSAFEDALPVRMNDDGSQTYGPYTNDTQKED